MHDNVIAMIQYYFIVNLFRIDPPPHLFVCQRSSDYDATLWILRACYVRYDGGKSKKPFSYFSWITVKISVKSFYFNKFLFFICID